MKSTKNGGVTKNAEPYQKNHGTSLFRMGKRGLANSVNL